MTRKQTIAIIGPGRLGSSLAESLVNAGYAVTEIVSQNTNSSRRRAKALSRRLDSRATTISSGNLRAEILWLCVPDAEISSVATELAGRKLQSKVALHSSGALASDELRALRQRGMAVAAAHPLMTFVRGALPSLKGVPFALEGDAAAVKIARRIAMDLGGEPFLIRKSDKPLYHAWGAFLSPLLIASLVTLEQVARAAGLSSADARRKMLPIVRQTIANYVELGADGAFSGPLVRGDAEVLRKHLRELKKVPHAREIYLALARAALKHLPVQNRRRLHLTLASER